MSRHRDRRTAQRATSPARVGGGAPASPDRDPRSFVDDSEDALERQLVELAKLHGWLAYHTRNSIGSVAGFPDWILLRGDTMLVIELKSRTGRVSDDQEVWLKAFAKVRRVVVSIIRPSRSTNLDELEEFLRVGG